MTWVTRREGEPIDSLIRRLSKELDRADVFADFKRHIAFTPANERRRFKRSRAAARRAAGQRRYQDWLAKQ